MNPIQEIADTIKEFAYRQAIALTSFEKVMQKKTPAERREMVSWFASEAEEMIEHGYHSDCYHGSVKRAIQKQCRFYTDKKAEAVMMSYYFSSPKDRETFRKDILIGHVVDRVSGLTPNPEFKKNSTLELGEKLIEYQWNLVRLYSGYVRKPAVALNMMAELSKQPTDEKEKIKQLIKDSSKITSVAGLEAGVPYLANHLLPYFYKECSQMYAEINRPEKIKRTKSILHSFAWLLLNQDQFNTMSTTDRGLFPMTKQQKYAILHEYSCHCC